MQTADISNGEFRPMLQFYVYVLIDPRDNSVFYVGEGQGERALNHVAEVRRLVQSGATLESRKHQRIKSILDDNAEPTTLVIARFDDKKQAHAVESVMINFVYDYGRLTNAVRGHGAEFVRRFGDMSRLLGIDIPEPVRTQDGTFRDENTEALRAAGAYELLERLRVQLSARGFAMRNFVSGTPDRPFDPGESNGWLGFIVPIHDVDFMITLSRTCRPGVSIANTVATRNTGAYAGLARIEEQKGSDFHAGPPKNNPVRGEGRYRDFGHKKPDGTFEACKPIFDPDNLEPLYALMNEFRDVLNPARE